MVSDGDTDCNWYSRYSPQRIGKGTGRLRDKKTSRDHPKLQLYKDRPKYEEEFSGDLRELAVTQTAM